MIQIKCLLHENEKDKSKKARPCLHALKTDLRSNLLLQSFLDGLLCLALLCLACMPAMKLLVLFCATATCENPEFVGMVFDFDTCMLSQKGCRNTKSRGKNEN